MKKFTIKEKSKPKKYTKAELMKILKDRESRTKYLSAKLEVTIDKTMLLWATNMQLLFRPPRKLDKKRILAYLINQIALFGTDTFTLIGDNWQPTDARPKAIKFVNKHWPTITDCWGNKDPSDPM